MQKRLFDGAAAELGQVPFEAVNATTGQIKVYLSGSFVVKPVKWWNGTSFVTKPLKVWNGSAFVITNY